MATVSRVTAANDRAANQKMMDLFGPLAVIKSGMPV